MIRIDISKSDPYFVNGFTCHLKKRGYDVSTLSFWGTSEYLGRAQIPCLSITPTTDLPINEQMKRITQITAQFFGLAGQSVPPISTGPTHEFINWMANY